MMSTSKQEYDTARDDINVILNETRPKHVGDGIISGVDHILRGAVGAAGIAVLVPGLAAAKGHQKGGVVGGAIGGVAGVVVGTVAAAGTAVGGVVGGVRQVVRGAVATPEAMIAPSQGKWWNESDGKWVTTDLEEAKHDYPEDDADILGPIWEKIEAAQPRIGIEGRNVKDPYYYDVLDIPTNASGEKVKRKYFILARKFNPGRAGNANNKAAAKKFREIGNAYVVLRDDKMRARYDKVGRDGMFKSDYEAEADNSTWERKVDPVLLYSFLFGSDKFDDYLGRLAAATSASIGDSTTITMQEGRTIQKRRVTRLALKLASRLSPWTKGEVNMAQATWMAAAEDLCKASYGSYLVKVIGKIYSLAAVQFLGSLKSGIGMPSISEWAKAQNATIRKHRVSNNQAMYTAKTDFETKSLEHTMKAEKKKANSSHDITGALAKIEEDMNSTVVRIMWTRTVVDITNTLHEVSQMVLFDQSVDIETRKKRGEGLKVLGEIFEKYQAPHNDDATDAQRVYEELAFAAMLEVIWRKEELARSKSNL